MWLRDSMILSMLSGFSISGARDAGAVAFNTCVSSVLDDSGASDVSNVFTVVGVVDGVIASGGEEFTVSGV
ncbi:hypothetical protein K402DRAFT_394657 [Aulographum hederae CBS 113979]|uniref:Uncharacterized protein n=1 Tax=Aulographum hederae CBS 113979 TaxID=1176131 RepID=A0A6G1GY35_9PEZI|nr:hypothetical protein K402DRAFT_394657 [Aulographum hederae CBS 113979]